MMNAKLNIGQKHVSHKLGKLLIEILHRQHTSESLILHNLGLVRLSTSILLQFKGDVEKSEMVQRKGYQDKQPRANNLGEHFWELDLFSLVKWRLRGDLITWITEQQLTKMSQTLWGCDNSISSSQKQLLRRHRLDVRIKFLFKTEKQLRTD